MSDAPPRATTPQRPRGAHTPRRGANPYACATQRSATCRNAPQWWRRGKPPARAPPAHRERRETPSTRHPAAQMANCALEPRAPPTARLIDARAQRRKGVGPPQADKPLYRFCHHHLRLLRRCTRMLAGGKRHARRRRWQTHLQERAAPSGAARGHLAAIRHQRQGALHAGVGPLLLDKRLATSVTHPA